MRARKEPKKAISETVHVRVRRDTLQKLREAIVHNGGVFHGCLQVEIDNALRDRIAKLETAAKEKKRA